MYKILFLDFDGVLNSKGHYGELEKEKLEILRHIIHATKCKIVISSSWRKSSLKDTIYDLVGDNDYTGTSMSWLGDVVGVTPLPDNPEFIEEAWPQCRGGEIDKYVTDNNISEYVILDDSEETEFFPHQYDHLVLTGTYTGLTLDIAKEVIKKLGESKE